MECSPWHDKSRKFVLLVWDRQKETLYGIGSTCEGQSDQPHSTVQGEWALR